MRTTWFSRFRDDDGGFALLTVVMAMFVLTIVATASLGYALQTQKASRHDQNWQGALAAARAGVDDLLAKLNKDDTYWQHYPGYSARSSDFDCTNTAWQRPVNGRSAPCGWSNASPVGWVTVPGSDRAQFHYDLDLSTTATNGVVVLTSTGRVGTTTRTVQSALRHGGFGEFLYLTDYETIDPANEAIYGYNNTAAQTLCSKHYYDGRNGGCADINFVGGDVLNGPVHSNDAIMTLGRPGPMFRDTVTTSWPACNGATNPSQWPNRCYRPNGSTSPVFSKGLAYRAPVSIPSTGASLLSQVDRAQTSTPGCLYTGPTRIVFNGDGTMKVWSNWSQGLLNRGCGDSGDSWPQTVNVPTNNVIYVQNVPSSQATPASGACAVGSIGDGLPVANDLNSTLRESDCRSGSVYLEGSLKGKVTVYSENNIVLTGDTTYSSGLNGLDTLGLISYNSVKVYHPVQCTSFDTSGDCTAATNLNRPVGTPFNEPTIHAAILTLSHSFTVQEYHLGASLGTLHFYGSFSQLYRGPVGTTRPSGYLKDYQYDKRLRYAPPPFFLDPVASSWGPKTFGEITPQYG